MKGQTHDLRVIVESIRLGVTAHIEPALSRDDTATAVSEYSRTTAPLLAVFPEVWDLLDPVVARVLEEVRQLAIEEGRNGSETHL